MSGAAAGTACADSDYVRNKNEKKGVIERGEGYKHWKGEEMSSFHYSLHLLSVIIGSSDSTPSSPPPLAPIHLTEQHGWRLTNQGKTIVYCNHPQHHRPACYRRPRTAVHPTQSPCLLERHHSLLNGPRASTLGSVNTSAAQEAVHPILTRSPSTGKARALFLAHAPRSRLPTSSRIH